MIESSDDLRASIRTLGENEPDPARVAEKLLAALSDEEAHIVSAAALPDYVRHVLTRPLQGGQTFETPDGRRFASRKVAAIVDWVESELNRSVYVAPAGEWKRLRDCTVDDVLALVASRRQKAAEVAAEADRHARLVKAMRKADAETVGDLARDVAAKALAR